MTEFILNYACAILLGFFAFYYIIAFVDKYFITHIETFDEEALMKKYVSLIQNRKESKRD